MADLTTLSPQEVWSEFEAITKIPRPSKREEKIRDYLIQWAESHHLAYQCDKTGNIVIRKVATAGYEEHPTVVLQAHMDMVCEKNTSKQFDFEHDAIETRIDDGWVKADGTTLGADDGIGIAAALALLASDQLSHPALEALFTVDEETGLTGAFGLGEGMLTGSYLLNLDSEDEGELFIGCAGGIDTVATFHPMATPAPDEFDYFRIDIKNLRGGHSGDDIDKGRANSNKIVARLLYELLPYGLVLNRIDGGNLRNAIPREAFAIFGVPKESGAEVCDKCRQFAVEIVEEFKYTEPDLQLNLSKVEGVAWVVDPVTLQALLCALVGVPNGVLSMSHSVEGLVETSTNLASVKFTNEGVVVVSSQRSSVDSAKRYAAQTVEAVFRIAGADVSHSDGYPGWTPNPDSHLLRITENCYKELFDAQPKVRAIHAGLECGLFLEKYPQLEMVSFGPTLRGVHSPDERIEIASVEKFWLLLCEVVKRL
jgi:dipeptidase D